MSAAEDELEDIDLPPEPSRNDIQDAQVVDEQLSDNPENDRSIIQSDEYLPEASASQDSEDHPGPSTSKNPAQTRASSRRIVPAMESNPFAEEPSYYTRPNRYFGPDSTWLSWTKEDRLVARTLDRLRSQNLSIHLLNAFALKRHEEASDTKLQTSRKGKSRAKEADGSDGSDNELAGSFKPPRKWTAWPLPPNQVPRESEISTYDDNGTYRQSPDPRPSAILEECIIATVTRFARKRWRSRSWAPEPVTMEQRTMKLEPGGDVEMTEDRRQSLASGSEAAETLDTDSESGSEKFVSQPWDMDEQPAKQASNVEVKSEADQSYDESDHRPTPVADDDVARSIVLPGTRHILSKLDDLLVGLHHARQAYATMAPRTSKKDQDRDSEELELVDTDNSSFSAKAGGKRKRSASTTRHTSSSSKRKHPRRSKVPLGLRDWSDVIGMAALTGWDPAVVQRASERCANLFGENMMFRTFFEGDAATKEASYFTEHFAASGDSSESGAEGNGQMVLTRTSRACKTCNRLKEKCEPGSDVPGTGPCKRCVTHDEAETCSGITVTLGPIPTSSKMWSDDTRCPYQTCDRHAIPFKKRYHLQRHIESVHKNSPPPLASSPSRPSSSAGEYVSASASEIICPILTCHRHEKGFSRGHQLYTHISNMHPEVNVEEVKKLERTRRGSRTGKWRDERRKRLRSRSRSQSVQGVEGGGDDEDEEDSDG